MKRITTLIAAFALTAFGWQAKAQVLNQNAAWPNAAWTLNGTYNAGALLSDPTTTTNFSYDDDAAGSGSTDILEAASPVIDLTTASTAGETWLNVDYDYNYNSGTTFNLEWFDADASSWVVWEALPDNSAATSGWCTAISAPIVTSATLDISGFTATQLSGFRYRFNYDASSTWGWGFCMSSPTIVSTAPPTCPVPTALTATNITPTTVDLGWTSTAAAWNIELGTAGFTPTGTPTITGTTTNPHNLSGLTAATSYDFYVKADCAANGVSTWAGPFSFSTTPDYCAGDHFYDNGGIAGNYSNNANETTVICPSTTGDVITATFNTFDTEAGWDDLTIYDGNGTGGTSFGTFDGTTIPGPFLATDITGCLTFVFNSDGGGTRAGWDATITCAPAPSCNAPTALTVANTTATTADLGWASTAAAWDIEWGIAGFTPTGTPTITGTTTNPHNLSGLTAATSYDFYVKADCAANGVSTWAGPFSFSTTPDYCAGDHFYDNGGIAGNYSNNANETTVICPSTTGDVITATFNTFDTEAGWDDLTIYDGNGTGGTSFGTFDGTTIPGPFLATDITGCLTFVFNSDGGGTRAGWDATITCAPAPSCNAPTALTVANTTATTADLGWASTAAAWDIEWGIAGFTPTGTPTITGTTTNPHNLSGLTAATSYDFYVKADCAANGVSTWAGPFSFSTTPINDNISDAIPLTLGIGACATPVTGTNAGATDSGTPHSCAFYNGGDVWYYVIVPAGGILSVEATITTGFTDGGMEAYSGPSSALVSLNCDDDDSPSGAMPAIYPADGLTGLTPGDTIWFAVWEYGNNSFGEFEICAWEPLPICLVPTTLTVANITNTSADLGWTSTATTWDVELGVAGFTATGIPTTASSTTNPTNVTGLTGGTAYDFYVRADCGADSSAWAGPFNFTTTSVGINESANNLGLSLYPNPNNGIFTLNIKAKNVLVKIMNTTGQVVLTKNNVNTNEQIDLSNNAKGIYFVTVTSNEAVTTQKVIVR